MSSTTEEHSPPPFQQGHSSLFQGTEQRSTSYQQSSDPNYQQGCSSWKQSSDPSYQQVDSSWLHKRQKNTPQQVRSDPKSYNYQKAEAEYIALKQRRDMWDLQSKGIKVTSPKDLDNPRIHQENCLWISKMTEQKTTSQQACNDPNNAYSQKANAGNLNKNSGGSSSSAGPSKSKTEKKKHKY